MNDQGTWKFSVARRSILLVLLLLSVLIISLIWNVQQYQLINDKHRHKIASEQEKAALDMASAARIQAQREKRAKEAVANKRMEELYREIDNLSQLGSQLLAQPIREPKSPTDLSSLEAPDDAP